MTVQNVPNFIEYEGNGDTTDFVFNFRVDDETWLQVSYLDNFDHIELNIDQDNSPGGTVFYSVAPPAGVELRFERSTPLTQLLNYTRYGSFDSEATEDSLDKLTMAIQDLVHLTEALIDDDFLRNIVEDLTPQLGGNLDANGHDIGMGDKEIFAPKLADYSVRHQVLAGTGNVNLQYDAGQSAAIVLTGNVTLESIINPPIAGSYGEVQILITQDGVAAFTITWPASFRWPGGEEPDLSELGSVHVVHAFTVDGGVNWQASFASGYAGAA